jgi:hypothetical protein
VASLGSNIPFQPDNNAIQQIRVNGFFNFGDNPQAAFVRNNFTWSDDLSWVKGKHDFRFGGVIERSRIDLDNHFFQPGEFSFPSLAFFLAGRLGDYPGQVAFRQGAGEFKNNRNTFAGIYVQDNFKVTRRLTLNLGLRYEPALPWREIKGRVQQFRLDGLMANVRSTQFPNAPPGGTSLAILVFPRTELMPVSRILRRASDLRMTFLATARPAFAVERVFSTTAGSQAS